jgi:hypothetical protein
MDENWFEKAWQDREDRIYSELFGDLGSGIYTLDQEVFGKFGQKNLDPRWLSHGVFECPPNDRRSSWLYVSSGLSNAWDDIAPNPDGISGLGSEFLMETVEQARWAIVILRQFVAYQILLAHGRYPGKVVLGSWDWIDLRTPIDSAASLMTKILFIPSPNYGGPQQLSTGQFSFLQIVGLTSDELAFMQEHGVARLHPLLLQMGAAPINDPKRSSIPLGKPS